MFNANNAKQAAAMWWLNFLRSKCGLHVSASQRFLGILQREIEVMNPDAEGKVRLYYRPDWGLPAEVQQAMQVSVFATSFDAPADHVMMEFADDYVHVTVNDREELIWRCSVSQSIQYSERSSSVDISYESRLELLVAAMSAGSIHLRADGLDHLPNSKGV